MLHFASRICVFAIKSQALNAPEMLFSLWSTNKAHTSHNMWCAQFGPDT